MSELRTGLTRLANTADTVRMHPPAFNSAEIDIVVGCNTAAELDQCAYWLVRPDASTSRKTGQVTVRTPQVDEVVACEPYKNDLYARKDQREDARYQRLVRSTCTVIGCSFLVDRTAPSRTRTIVLTVPPRCVSAMRPASPCPVPFPPDLPPAV